MPVFVGDRRQAGGNFFSTLSRFAMPILRFFAPHLKRLGTSVGKSALSLGSGVVSDLVSGQAKQIPENFRKRGRAELGNIRDDVVNSVFAGKSKKQKGRGRKRKHSAAAAARHDAKRIKKAKRKPINTKRKSRKQSAAIHTRDIFDA